MKLFSEHEIIFRAGNYFPSRKLFSEEEIIFQAGILFFVIINFSGQDCSERIVFGYLALGLIKYTGAYYKYDKNGLSKLTQTKFQIKYFSEQESIQRCNFSEHNFFSMSKTNAVD